MQLFLISMSWTLIKTFIKPSSWFSGLFKLYEHFSPQFQTSAQSLGVTSFLKWGPSCWNPSIICGHSYYSTSAGNTVQWWQWKVVFFIILILSPFSVGCQALWQLCWLTMSQLPSISQIDVGSTSGSLVFSPHLWLLTSSLLTPAVLEDVPPMALASLGGIFQQLFGPRKLLVASAIPSLLSWVAIIARPTSIPCLLSSRCSPHSHQSEQSFNLSSGCSLASPTHCSLETLTWQNLLQETFFLL